MSGKRLLSYMQFGKEVTSGTPVAATRRMDTDLTSAFTVDWMKTYHEGRTPGYHNPVQFSTQMGTRVDIQYRSPSDTGVSYDALPFFFHFPYGGTAGSTVGSSITTWSWSWGGTSPGTPTSYTIEFGDDIQAFEAEYCQASRVRVSSEAMGLTQIEADFFGRQSSKVTKTTLTGTLGVRIPGYRWTLAHATSGSGLAAATAQQNFLVNWDAEWTTGLVPRFYMDGNTYFGQSQQSAPFTGNLHLVVASNSSAISQYYDKGAAGTNDFVRLAAPGGTIAGGTTYNYIHEFAVEYTNVVPLGGETDGENYYDVTARLVTDATWGQSMGATVVNVLPNLTTG